MKVVLPDPEGEVVCQCVEGVVEGGMDSVRLGSWSWASGWGWGLGVWGLPAMPTHTMATGDVAMLVEGRLGVSMRGFGICGD